MSNMAMGILWNFELTFFMKKYTKWNNCYSFLNAITYVILTSVTVKTIPSEKSTRSPDVAKH
jgi:hypothetical protein